MDLHWPAFKMDSSSYLPGPLASPALMVLASTAKTGRDASVPCQASIPCQPPRSFRVPISEKDLPFPSGSYTFASMYNRQGPISGHGSFPASLLHLNPQFQFHPNNLDCPSLGMLNHIGVGAFRPFSSPPEEREASGYQSAFTPAKRLKGCYTDSEGKEYDFGGGCFLSGSPGSLKAAEDSGRKLFTVSGLLSDREASSSPEDRKEHLCPVCHAVLPPGELQEHMEQEMGRLAQLQISTNSVQRNHPLGATKTLSLSLHIKCEGGSPTSLPCPPEEPHSDRYQTFLRVRTNRHTRLNVDDWCYAKPAPLSPHNRSHLTPDCKRSVRIGKLKRRRPYEGQDILLDLGRGEEEWSERRRIRMTSILGGCDGSVFVSSSTSKEGGGDSDADLDRDGDDTLHYGRVQCTEADIPCSGQDPGEVEEWEALRGALLTGGTLSNRGTLEHSKWTNEGSPSTSNGESNKLDNSIASLHRTCKNSDIDMASEDSGLTTLDSLRSRIRDLEKQLSRGDGHNCLICRDTYTTPLTSIQCWHAHCEECWLRTLGAKKLCPQCNTITSPGDLRRVFL
ncbi:E3 ubiquitin-protein ligase RNF220 [Salmo trutta]|uniref:E3 ubiquitin-protein ligase RNF220 n=1 Tax=Salmo trutta TaxID=8032 RepID=UPI00112FF0D5|nr:E3 ubiquitin-protein ligase RNF220-like [Salmo trutta]